MTTNRLHPDALTTLPAAVIQPTYDRNAVKAGIVHLGLGAFHRAHQAVYTEQAIAVGGGNWGIVGVSLRSDQVSRQLQPQAGLYSVMSEDARGPQLQVIGAIKEVLVAPKQPEKVIDALASRQTKIVTLTITEKGYCLADDGHSLNCADPVIAADLANPQSPSSAVGLLALGLKRRAELNSGALTIISCDNLVENSRLLHAVLMDYIGRCFGELLDWMASNVSFPCSMVDRIVPAAEPAQRQRQSELLGVEDKAAVATEPFTQWLIEDKFCTNRPDWEAVGVQLVEVIGPYENIKLRLLNASHSAIAYTGLLAGIDTVDQVMAEPALGQFVKTLMLDDLMPVLEVPAGFDLQAYQQQLVERFSNPCLGHRCQQIAMDGSEKIAQRWLATLQAKPDSLSLNKAISIWCYFILCTDHAIEDPRRERLLAQRLSTAPLPERITEILDCARINRASVTQFSDTLATIQLQVETIAEHGVRQLLTQ